MYVIYSGHPGRKHANKICIVSSEIGIGTKRHLIYCIYISTFDINEWTWHKNAIGKIHLLFTNGHQLV